MIFFLDIFNQLLKINEDSILIIFDIDGEIWFALRDIYKVLGYNNINKVINKTNIKTNNKEYYKNLRLCPRGHIHHNFQPNQIFVNEPGLYEVLLKSNKSLAEIFTLKLLTDIMPEIRKKGKYILKETDKKKLDKLNNKLDNYKKELTYYYDKYDFELFTNGYFYINEDIIIKNGKKIKCYKIGYCKDMNKRMQSYKVGNFNYKPLAYLTLNFTNGKEIEDCVKDKYKPHIIKLKTDTICHITLTKLKEEILNCITELNNHICNCMICKKKYKFKNVDTHKCYNNSKFIDITKKLSKKSSKKKSSKKLSKKKSSKKKLSK